MYFLKFQWLQNLDLPILDYHRPNDIHLTTDIKVYGSKLLVIPYRRARASSAWSNPGSTRLGRPGRLGAGQGPSQLDLVNCTLLQF